MTYDKEINYAYLKEKSPQSELRLKNREIDQLDFFN